MTRATTILLSGIGGPTPRAMARALKLHGRYGPYRIIGTDVNPRALGLYQRSYVDRAYIVPQAGHTGYWEALAAICSHEGVDGAMVQPEAEVEAWALRFELNRPLPCCTILPSYAFVRLARDKAQMHDLLADTSYVPRYVRIKTHGHDITALGESLGYPFWIRVTKGSSGAGSYRVTDPHQAQAWMALNANVSEFLATEYLPGRNLACQLLYEDGTLMRAACAERVHYIMANVAPSGVTGNCSFGRLLNYPDAIMFSSECVATICARLGATVNGVVTVDLKEDRNGAPRVTEVNVRHVAITEAFAAAGANLVEDHLSLILGRAKWVPVPVLHVFQEPLVFLRGVDAEPLVLQETDIISAASGPMSGAAEHSGGTGIRQP